MRKRPTGVPFAAAVPLAGVLLAAVLAGGCGAVPKTEAAISPTDAPSATSPASTAPTPVSPSRSPGRTGTTPPPRPSSPSKPKPSMPSAHRPKPSTPRPHRTTPKPKPRTPRYPSGATAVCRDGSLSFSAHRRGTCSHHGGVARWL
ncbi:DUF3761 domain-containing protein [Spirillospora sp. NPDC049652]